MKAHPGAAVNSTPEGPIRLAPTPRKCYLYDMSTLPPLRIAVIGAGNLGKHHARLLCDCPGARLVGVVDIIPERAQGLAEQCGVVWRTDYRDFLDQVDAVSVVTPTSTHYEIALTCLLAGKHTFVEKPITTSVDEARELCRAAALGARTLQVGHVERFNAAVLALDKFLVQPRFVESHRLGPLASQVRDVGVVLDLMIHDLDLILTLVKSPIRSIDAIGIPVVTEHEDIANARLVFQSGCVANVTVSRITDRKMRKIRVFQQDAYLSLDCLKGELDVYEKVSDENGFPSIRHNVHQTEGHNALWAELCDFVECCRSGRRPLVGGEEAREALALAIEITERIATHPLAREAR